ncbi:acyltransferase family protein [Parasphingopyxis marina]|uniref:Acyltransferase n=1 Tax=Parasphingopyxis marina TaxID=2761622 RepID=A0A842HZX0_9SPHN|nr:acyltransferase [Parasphingopyxis marina]MBC2778425.1 acyltransferase [Parasphingopyxis marina]
MTAKPDLEALTSLRGIAAWFVVLYHVRLACVTIMPAPALALFAKGYLAVDFFFLLSGFVIWLSYRDRIAEGGKAAIPRYLARRFARIYPLHAVILTGAVGFALLLRAIGRANPAEYPFAELPLHYLLIQNWGFTDALAWNDPAWSISTEFAAYLLFPVIALATDWRRLSTPILLAAVSALILLLHGLFGLMAAPILDHAIPRTGLLRCLVQFSIGTILCALWMRWREKPALPALLSALAALLFAALALCADLPETLGAPAAFAAALLAAALTAQARANPLNIPALRYLGDISYATYLAHFLLFVLFKILFVGDDGQLGAATLVGFLLLTFAVSAALYHLIERPAQRLLNARFDALFARRAGAA